MGIIKLDHDETVLIMTLLEKHGLQQKFYDIVDYIDDQEYADESVDTIAERVADAKISVQLLKNKIKQLYDSFY